MSEQIVEVKSSIKRDGQKLIVYEDRVEITKKDTTSFFNTMTSKTIPISSITSVQLKPPGKIIGGFIAFSIPGGNERQGSSTFNAVTDENAFVIFEDSYPAACKAKKYIDDAIANRKTGSTSVVNQLSPAEEIKRFKELLDLGIITQEEFEAKKKQLLGL